VFASLSQKVLVAGCALLVLFGCVCAAGLWSAFTLSGDLGAIEQAVAVAGEAASKSADASISSAQHAAALARVLIMSASVLGLGLCGLLVLALQQTSRGRLPGCL